MATRGARLIGNGISAVLARGDASANSVAALSAFVGASDLALEGTASGFTLGANALALGLFRLAIRLTLGVFGLLLFVFEALGLFASGIALSDLL